MPEILPLTWKGYKEYHAEGTIKNLPMMMGFEAEGSAAIVRGERILKPETLATAIRIGNPASWKQAEAARDESKGKIGCVSDEKIVEAYKSLPLQKVSSANQQVQLLLQA